MAAEVIAPALIPTAPRDRVETDSRDCRRLARPYQAGELVSTRIPDGGRGGRAGSLLDPGRPGHRLEPGRAPPRELPAAPRPRMAWRLELDLEASGLGHARLSAYRGVTHLGALSLAAEVCDWRRFGTAVCDVHGLHLDDPLSAGRVRLGVQSQGRSWEQRCATAKRGLTPPSCAERGRCRSASAAGSPARRRQDQSQYRRRRHR